jgi:phage/plasmid-associated DNA primase
MKKSENKFEREIQRLRAEVRRLRARLRSEPKGITKRELRKLIKHNKSNKALARYFKVSTSTIKRRIREHGLTGLRRPGRKPLVKKPKVPKLKEKWISTRQYIDELDKEYHFINIQYPPFKYINPKTLVCSDRKGNPRGKFTTVGAYFIAEQSDVYFINYSRIRYSETPADFEEIYAWAKENFFDALSVQTQRASFAVERIIAFTFLLPEHKPKVIKA